MTSTRSMISLAFAILMSFPLLASAELEALKKIIASQQVEIAKLSQATEKCKQYSGRIDKSLRVIFEVPRGTGFIKARTRAYESKETVTSAGVWAFTNVKAPSAEPYPVEIKKVLYNSWDMGTGFSIRVDKDKVYLRMGFDGAPEIMPLIIYDISICNGFS